MQAVAAEFRKKGIAVEDPGPRPRQRSAAFTRLSTSRMIKETAGRAVALDPDTFTSPHTWDAAHDGGRCSHQRGGPRAGQGHRRTRIRAGASTGTSRRAREGDGLLFLQQHCHRCRARAGARPLARRHRRLRRASRQRHAVELLRRPIGAVRVVASISLLSRAPAPRATSARARATGFTVNLPLSAGATDADYEVGVHACGDSGARAVSTRARAGLGGLRCSHGRPACGHAVDERLLRKDDARHRRRG